MIGHYTFYAAFNSAQKYNYFTVIFTVWALFEHYSFFVDLFVMLDFSNITFLKCRKQMKEDREGVSQKQVDNSNQETRRRLGRRTPGNRGDKGCEGIVSVSVYNCRSLS